MIAVPRPIGNGSPKNPRRDTFVAMPIYRNLAGALAAAGLMGAAIGLFSAARIFATAGRRTAADRLLSSLLLVCAANVVHGLIDFRPGARGILIVEPLQFLIPLGLAWYARALGGSRPARPADAFHIGLPLAFIVASYLPGAADARLPSGVPVFFLAMWVAIAASAAFLLIPVVHEVARYRRGLEQEYSNVQGKDAAWLASLLLLIGGLFVAYAVLAFAMVHAGPAFPQRQLLVALMAVFTTIFSWLGLGRKTPILRPSAREDAANGSVDAELRSAGELMRNRIEEEKLYLDPELSLDDLARTLRLSRHRASEILNRGLGVSFFDLINGYRVEEFKRLCAQPPLRGEKIMTLALEAGFNSKPSFNLVFKRIVGRTPSEYRASSEIASHPDG